MLTNVQGTFVLADLGMCSISALARAADQLSRYRQLSESVSTRSRNLVTRSTDDVTVVVLYVKRFVEASWALSALGSYALVKQYPDHGYIAVQPACRTLPLLPGSVWTPLNGAPGVRHRHEFSHCRNRSAAMRHARHSPRQVSDWIHRVRLKPSVARPVHSHAPKVRSLDQ